MIQVFFWGYEKVYSVSMKSFSSQGSVYVKNFPFSLGFQTAFNQNIRLGVNMSHISIYPLLQLLTFVRRDKTWLFDTGKFEGFQTSYFILMNASVGVDGEPSAWQAL